MSRASRGAARLISGTTAAGAAWRQRAGPESTAAATADLGVILVDTSVWVDHLRAGDKALAALLDVGAALTHPFVIGELALDNRASARPY